MNDLVLLLIFLVVGFSLLLFIISLLSATRMKSWKTVFLSLAFAFFFIKGLYVLYLTVFTNFSNQGLLITTSVLDLAILFFIYASVLK
ncbi:MAG: hypothetical protein M1422_07920 [Candidatus Thermoplasmatota archaeon]|jgi:hypothetical protein|nr:hypothetical protein [Candidatus Sysuiplasma jiujiangense]MBX8638766.1 hypothetical protein [Candidatus Sysuiplasma jiujiangense]MBX8642306.1 hypothetical protein [Candidatus Sysuiplasma jiujiangense]MCL4318181.1 hypothetical protein [Candidatus Thermoplasmatota archaeon]